MPMLTRHFSRYVTFTSHTGIVFYGQVKGQNQSVGGRGPRARARPPARRLTE